jgi:hypothetical protein
MSYQWKTITIPPHTSNGAAWVKIDKIALTVGVDLSYCGRCRRRQCYVQCSRCQMPLCALCSWQQSHPRPGHNGIVDERCRECVEP